LVTEVQFTEEDAVSTEVSVKEPVTRTSTEIRTGLKTGALPLYQVIMQGVATIAPAFAIISTFQFAVSEAGLAAPIVYVIAFALVFLIATTIGQVAKELPSAGGFSTYVSRAVHPFAGFLTGWVFILWFPPAATVLAAYFCKAILEPELKSQWSVTIPWWIATIVLLVIAIVIVGRGISISTKALVVLGLLEIAIVVALAISAVISPGPGGFSLAPLNPGNASSAQGLYLGVVFSIFAFSGWEAVTPVAEETQNPRRNTPRALLGAVTVLGFFFAVTSWLFMVGLGTHNVSAIASSSANPVFMLANRVWGGAWVILILALLNSVVAVSVACFNAGSRMFYALGRAGALPRTLGTVDARQAPTTAFRVQIVATVATFIFACIYGPVDTFALWGLSITLGLILTYIAVNIGVIRHYLTEARAEFNPWLHGVLPVAGALAVAWVFYKSVSPLPAAPAKYAPIVLGVWLLIGVGVIVSHKVRGDDSWLVEARKAAELIEDDQPEPWPAQP
jgi:amino acid transporter